MTRSDALGSVDLRAPRFISDLHLSSQQPCTVARFLRLTQQISGGELLILGDLFEFWAGDDEMAAGIGATVVQALRAAADRGMGIYLMRGNRDVLLGGRFAAAAGATMLADPCLAHIQGVPTLLSHGDAYCTRDVAYQAFRRLVHNPVLQRGFLTFSLERRRALLGQVRRRSDAGKRSMAAEIMDVTPAAIQTALRRARVGRLIHGHTHRPGLYRLALDGREAERWVLPDWDFDGPTPRGGLLQFSGGGPEIVTV